MEKDNQLTKRLSDLYVALQNTPIPKSFNQACQDLDIELFEYDALVNGLVERYLNGFYIEPTQIQDSNKLDIHVTKCIERINAINDYKEKLNELIRTLMQCVDTT